MILRRQPDPSRSSATRSSRSRRVVMPLHQQRLADDIEQRHARIERGERVLEDHLHCAQRAAVPRGSRRHLDHRAVRCTEADLARGRLDGAQDTSRVVVFPQPLSPTSPSVSPSSIFTSTRGRRWGWSARAAAARPPRRAASCGPSIRRRARSSCGHRSGSVIDMAAALSPQLRALRREMQMIFQDPFTSLNPRMTLLDIVGEPLLVHGMTESPRARRSAWRSSCAGSGCGRSTCGASRTPSAGAAAAHRHRPGAGAAPAPGGCRRAGLRAGRFGAGPDSESAVDLQDRLRLTYLFVAHDLSVVKHISDRVAVMYVGRIVEMAATDELFQAPKHPYTAALLSAVPEPDPRTRAQTHRAARGSGEPRGSAQRLLFPPPLSPRDRRVPHSGAGVEEISPAHFAACHRAHELDLPGVD